MDGQYKVSKAENTIINLGAVFKSVGVQFSFEGDPGSVTVFLDANQRAKLAGRSGITVQGIN